MHPGLRPAIERLDPIDLASLETAAGLMSRMDRKYVVDCESLAGALAGLGGLYRALEIDGAREFDYRSTYYDTADLLTYRDHAKGRRRRFKVRTREYLHSGERALEVKLKGTRGRTIKRRTACAAEAGDRLGDDAAAFLADCLAHEYGQPPPPPMRTSLFMSFSRITLVAPELGERATVDTRLSFSAPQGGGGRMRHGVAIVESKSASGATAIDAVLRQAGIRPETACSKYCVGLAVVHPAIPANAWRHLLRRYFEPRSA